VNAWLFRVCGVVGEVGLELADSSLNLADWMRILADKSANLADSHTEMADSILPHYGPYQFIIIKNYIML
jgi:hypothetical protein